MYFLRSWKESLLVFIPKNFKNFMLVTLKNAMSVYAHLAYNFWWLLLLAFVTNIGCFYPQCALRGPIWDLVSFIISLFLEKRLLITSSSRFSPSQLLALTAIPSDPGHLSSSPADRPKPRMRQSQQPSPRQQTPSLPAPTGETDAH